MRLLLALAIAVSAASCTLLVDRQLDACDEARFQDGTDAGGRVFHGGVTQVQWHGPAFAPAGTDVSAFGAALSFLADGGVEMAGGFTDGIFLRSEESIRPTIVYPGGFHLGPGSFGCAEHLAATYDPLHNSTSWELISGGCEEIFYSFDGGVTSGSPESQGPALGWAPAADGGGIVSALYGNRAESCDEKFPLACVPPQATFLVAGGARTVDGMTASDGGAVWAVTIALPPGDGETRVYSQDFRGAGLIVPWAGSVTVMDADVGLVARISQGTIQAQLFDSTGTKKGATSSIDLNDPGAKGLLIARFGGTGSTARAAWIGGDGNARAGVLDVSSPGQLLLSGQQTICQSAGVSFAAPIAPSTVVVQAGEALFLRPVR